MSALLERLGVERPVVQAGMGGGLAGHELAAAVSGAGGLGTIGILAADTLAREIAAARERTGRPIAVNLLLPFARRAPLASRGPADAVVTFWGRPRRHTTGVWIHQCGSVEEALAAREAGADAVIAQGVEAGGHVRGTTPALTLLERTRAALGPGYPVLVAGGIADARDVRRARRGRRRRRARHPLPDDAREPRYEGLQAAADGVARDGAHRAVRRRLARAPHRVIWNEAAERWLAGDPRGPRWVRALHLVSSPTLAGSAVEARRARADAESRPAAARTARGDGRGAAQPARLGAALRGRERGADPRPPAGGRAGGAS